MTDLLGIKLATIEADHKNLAETTKTHQIEIAAIKEGINNLNVTCSNMGENLKNVVRAIESLAHNVSKFGEHYFVEKDEIKNNLHDLRIKDVSKDARLEALKLELTSTSTRARYAQVISIGLAVSLFAIIILMDIFGAETAGQFAAGVRQATKH